MAYEINININGDYEEGDGDISGVSKGTSKTDKSGSDNKVNSSVKALGLYVVSQTITPMVFNAIERQTQTIEVKTGSKQQQQALNASINRVKGVVNSAMTGAAIGAVGGPLGMVAGAAIGVIVGEINRMVEIENNQKLIDLQRQVENTALQGAYARAGGAEYNRSRSGI